MSIQCGKCGWAIEQCVCFDEVMKKGVCEICKEKSVLECDRLRAENDSLKKIVRCYQEFCAELLGLSFPQDMEVLSMRLKEKFGTAQKGDKP